MQHASAAEISDRLAKVLGSFTLEEVVTRLGAVGYETSGETVRRYREGATKRIDSAFLSAVVSALGADPAWLLGVPDAPVRPGQKDEIRVVHSLRNIAFAAAADYVGPRSKLDREEAARRETIQHFLVDLARNLMLDSGEAADVFTTTAAQLRSGESGRFARGRETRTS